jgi:AAA+ ATPase superfamily predicted ATPase
MKHPQIPFLFGRVVSSPHFINREDELDRLKKNLISGLNTILISPRRWGKSSLVNKVVEQLSGEPKVRFCMLDLFNIRTEKEFYEVYTREVLRCSSSKWEDWIETTKTFLKGIVPRFSFGPDPYNDFSISLETTPTSKTRHELLNLPEAIAKSKKIKIVIGVDEFQNLMYYDDPTSFQQELRTAWQHHKNVTYCLYGSKRHMITELFENKSMPFYKFGDLIFLPKIELRYWHSPHGSAARRVAGSNPAGPVRGGESRACSMTS